MMSRDVARDDKILLRDVSYDTNRADYRLFALAAGDPSAAGL
jgi:hypothetical protein